MKKIVFIISAAFLLNSCVVSTAAKGGKRGGKCKLQSSRKGTVNGISWAVSKAKGKIDEDRIDGTWKVVGVYRGSFEDFTKIRIRKATLHLNVQTIALIRLFSIPENQNSNRCTAVRIKKSGRNTLWSLGKNPITKEKKTI